jgi:hypothetical protein
MTNFWMSSRTPSSPPPSSVNIRATLIDLLTASNACLVSASVAYHNTSMMTTVSDTMAGSRDSSSLSASSRWLPS